MPLKIGVGVGLQALFAVGPDHAGLADALERGGVHLIGPVAVLVIDRVRLAGNKRHDAINRWLARK